MAALPRSPLSDIRKVFTSGFWLVAMMGLPLNVAAKDVPASRADDADLIIESLDKDALPDFISTLTDKGKIRRFHIVTVEGDVQDHRASQYLRQAYEGAASEGVRCKLLESLGKLHDPALLPWLSRRAVDPHISIQCFAIWALGELKTSRAVPILLMKLWSSNRFVEMTAIDALGKTGKNPRMAAELDPFLKDEDVEVRYLSAKALMGVAGEDSAPELIQRLMQEPSLDVQEALARTLGHVGGAVAVGHLIELLKNPPSETTEHWVDIGLQSADPHVVIPALTPLLESPDLRLKVAAAHILKEMDLQSGRIKP